MDAMTPSFDSALDLSALAAKAAAPAAATSAGASYVMTADDRTFEAVMAKSMQHPVVVEFTSPRANAQTLSDDLTALANAAGGKWLLVRVDIDASPALAQALGIQAVPFVVGALGGQLVPLFQGTQDKAQVAAVIDQLLQAAVGNGIVGQAQPVAGGPAAPQDAQQAPEPVADPRFAAADAAMEAGDYAAAVGEFDKILAQTPSDHEALAGKAGAELLVRTAGVDPAQVVARAQAEPGDVDAQMDAADLELLGGYPERAFARLVDAVRVTAGDERERVRVRLLALFETVGASDPAVVQARRDLMTALF